jgi:hypothetical protein
MGQPDIALLDSHAESISPDASALARFLADYLNQIAQGKEPDPAGALIASPEQARTLRFYLDELAQLQRAVGGVPEKEERDTPGEGWLLGDFRILAEIGRGGTGIVYEAEQVSIQRRVAVKVLPFAAVLHPHPAPRLRLRTPSVRCKRRFPRSTRFAIRNSSERRPDSACRQRTPWRMLMTRA